MTPEKETVSDNCFLGTVNAFSGEAGQAKNQLTGKTEAFPRSAGV
jgi:hypothetical protein